MDMAMGGHGGEGEVEIGLAVPSWSHSRSEAMACPFYFKALYVDLLPLPPSVPAIKGKVVHGIIERYLNRLVAERFSTDWQWWETESAITVGRLDGEMQVDVEKMLSNFGGNYSFDPETIFEVEWHIAADFEGNKIAYEERRGFRGVLDLVELGRTDDGQGLKAKAHDWKTGYKVPSAEEAKRNKQMRRYAWLLFCNIEGLVEVELNLHFLRYNRILPVVFTVDELEQIGAEIKADYEDALRRVKDDDWPAEPGSACTFCRLRCPHEGTAAEPERPETLEAAQALLQQRQMHEAMSGRIDYWLELYAGHHGPVNAGGKVAGFSTSESRQYPDSETPNIIAMARTLGIDEKKLTRPETPAKLRDLVLKEPKLKEKFGDPTIQYGKTSFGVRNG